MFIQTVNPNNNKSVKVFEEMTEKSVDAKVDKLHKVQVAFVDWKETQAAKADGLIKLDHDETPLSAYPGILV